MYLASETAYEFQFALSEEMDLFIIPLLTWRLALALIEKCPFVL